MSQALPAFLTANLMPLTYSITIGTYDTVLHRAGSSRIVHQLLDEFWFLIVLLSLNIAAIMKFIYITFSMLSRYQVRFSESMLLSQQPQPRLQRTPGIK
jgi:hypothetical protein